MVGKPWPLEKEEELRKLASYGDLSAAQISAKLGFSRNSIIAKMQRLQIPSKYNEKLLASSFKKALLKEKKKRNMEKKKTCKDLSALHDKSFYTGGSDSKTMFDLGPNDCRWPVEDNGKVATMFCAKKAIGSYCKEHAEIAYQ